MSITLTENGSALEVVAVTPDEPVFDDVLDLRYQVLDASVGEPRRTEPLPKDLLPSTQHYVGIRDEQVIATLRVERQRDTRHVLSRVAIAPGFQGLGLGSQLVSHAERRTRDVGGRVMSLLARPAVTGFYTLLGYEHTGVVITTQHYDYEQMRKRLIE